MRFARRILAWNAWFFVVAGMYLLVIAVERIITYGLRPTTLAVPVLLWLAPGAAILLTRPSKPTTVWRWLDATSLGDFGWAVVFGGEMAQGPYDGARTIIASCVVVALVVFLFLSLRGALETRRVIKRDLEGWSLGAAGPSRGTARHRR